VSSLKVGAQHAVPVFGSSRLLEAAGHGMPCSYISVVTTVGRRGKFSLPAA
jgi:hypothetical protein